MIVIGDGLSQGLISTALPHNSLILKWRSESLESNCRLCIPCFRRFTGSLGQNWRISGISAGLNISGFPFSRAFWREFPGSLLAKLSGNSIRLELLELFTGEARGPVALGGDQEEVRPISVAAKPMSVFVLKRILSTIMAPSLGQLSPLELNALLFLADCTSKLPYVGSDRI